MVEEIPEDTKVGYTMNVTEDEGVVKKILRAPQEDGEYPKEGDEVTVHYIGKLENGEEFDSSYGREDPFVITLGKGMVIKGWDLGIAKMRLGEMSRLTIKPEYGYGDKGAGDKIPGGATLVFDVDLLKIGERKSTRWMMDDKEKYENGLKKKEEGNVSFKNKDYATAHKIYNEALEYLVRVRKPTEEMNSLMKTVYLNLSVVCNNLGKYKETLTNCTQALDIDSTAAKAHYLRAVAFHKISEFDDAVDEIKEAIKLAPSDKNLRDEFEKIK